jgi:osmotically-inducible protein OsmY
VDRIEALELQLQIAETIHTAPELEGARVRVELVDDVVSLEGRVVTAAQKARAEQIVRTFEGVRRVENGLVVADRPGQPIAGRTPS